MAAEYFFLRLRHPARTAGGLVQAGAAGGRVHGTQAALRRMMPRDRGTIVQVSTVLAYRAIPIQSADCAAKHAILGFTDALRCELRHPGFAERGAWPAICGDRRAH